MRFLSEGHEREEADPIKGKHYMAVSINWEAFCGCLYMRSHTVWGLLQGRRGYHVDVPLAYIELGQLQAEIASWCKSVPGGSTYMYAYT